MLAESQVSGLFLRLFWHLPEGLQPKSPDFSKKTISGIGTHRGATFLGCFRQNLSLKALYIDENQYKSTKY